jgi:short-subunit dehydrogenase
MRFPVRVAATAAGAATAAALWRRLDHEDDLADEVAIVTGASRGLGLLIATELGRRGCRLLLCARDGAELDRAAGRLRSAGAQVATVACDITDENAAGLLVDTALERYGQLDIAISNAGIIRVGPVQSTSPADYETALATMALGPVRLALAALPAMQARGHGRIVTIASIGGKLSVPHLLPYSTAKFAAVGFSEGLRAELGRGPVTVTTVVPGLMRTGSHVQAEFTGRKEQEFTWFSLGASLPLISMDAERAARQIVAGMAARRPEVLLTPAAQVAGRLAGLAPEITAAVLHAAQDAVLPAADGDGEAVPGRQLRPALPSALFGVLTSLGRSAAARFNELGRRERVAQPPTKKG